MIDIKRQRLTCLRSSISCSNIAQKTGERAAKHHIQTDYRVHQNNHSCTPLGHYSTQDEQSVGMYGSERRDKVSLSMDSPDKYVTVCFNRRKVLSQGDEPKLQSQAWHRALGMITMFVKKLSQEHTQRESIECHLHLSIHRHITRMCYTNTLLTPWRRWTRPSMLLQPASQPAGWRRPTHQPTHNLRSPLQKSRPT